MIYGDWVDEAVVAVEPSVRSIRGKNKRERIHEKQNLTWLATPRRQM